MANVSRDSVLALIFEVVSETNTYSQGKDKLDAKPDTILVGPGSQLSSIGFVSLIVEIETKLSDSFQRPISLANEKAMSLKNSPFKTISSLADFATAELNSSDE